MKVPLLDLKRQYKYIKNDITTDLLDICEKQTFVLGEIVQRFEREMAKYCETQYAVGVASGTDALILALDQAGIKPGDEVITTPFTFFATASSITRLGAIPVFADISPNTFNINPDRMEEKITEKTKAIIPVHLFGQCADMDFINSIARKNNIKVIEDACQSVGAKYNGKKAGSLGDLGTFSFFPSKNLGAFGDGGLITANNQDDHKRLLSMRMHGETVKYYHDFIGYNSRLDTIQAIVLLKKLKYLDNWHELRRKNAQFYNEFFANEKMEEFITPPFESSVNYHIYNQYTIVAKNRDELKYHLEKNEVGCAIYYPVPLHLQKCFSYLGYKEGDMPVSEKMANAVLSLPVYPEITQEELEYVAVKIKEFYGK